MSAIWRDFSVSTVLAGGVAVWVGFTSSAALVFAAAQALGANEAQTVSWMWALGLGMGGTGLRAKVREMPLGLTSKKSSLDS